MSVNHSIKDTYCFLLLLKLHSTYLILFDRLQEVSEVALTQVAALQARHKSKDKEVEALKTQILDYQVREVVFLLGALLHQMIYRNHIC